MKISFFEEFPDNINFEQLNKLTFNPSLYIASPTKEKIIKLKKKLPEYHIVWWVVLPKHAGYWVSSFTSSQWIYKMKREFKKYNDDVMLDIEKPVLSPWLFLTQLKNKNRNRERLCNLIHENKEKIIICEVPKKSLCDVNCRRIWMFYTSLKAGSLDSKMEKLKKVCKKGMDKFNKKFKIGIGCAGHGMFKVESQLSIQELKLNLKTASETGIKESIIFRLGGVLDNPDMVRELNKIHENSSII